MARTGDTTPPTESGQDLLERVHVFAAEFIGPASERIVSKPGVQALILSRVRRGMPMEDAVLAELHRSSAEDRVVADEFLAYFLADLHKAGRLLISRGLRRFLETGDLVNSVLGDLWTDMRSVTFESRAQFVGFLTRKMYWKGADNVRKRMRAKTREDLRVEASPEELQIPSRGRTPLSLVECEEEVQNLALVLMRMSQQDRELLRDHLCGKPISAMAEERGLAYHAMYARLNRALETARKLYAR